MPLEEVISQPGDPLRRKMRFDEGTDSIVFETVQPNLDEVLATNAALLNAERSSSSLWAGRNWVKVGQVPLILCEQLHKQGYRYGTHEFNAKVVSMLNDRDYSRLRTAPGRI